MSICQELYPTDEACRDAIVRLTEQNKGLEGALEEERIEVTRLANIVERLTTQRNALREALEKIANRLDYNSSHEDGVADEMQSVAQSVLDATKEPV